MHLPWRPKTEHVRPAVVLGTQMAAAVDAERLHQSMPHGESPLGGISYDCARGELDLFRFVVSLTDRLVADVVERSLAGNERSAVNARAALRQADLYSILAYARRCAVAALRTGSDAPVLAGIRSLCLIDVDRVDWRDAAIASVLLAYAGDRVGARLDQSIAEAARPPIGPRAISVGIVHLGVSAFHRAHQAVYTQAAMAASGDTSWGICGVTQRSADVVAQLAPQDGLYSVLQRGGDTSISVLAPMRELLFAGARPNAVAARIADAATRVVTLTVTEKGYRHDPATGRLRVDDTEIKADAEGGAPLTVIGQLVRGFQQRLRADAGPLTVVCCDNLPHNGHTLARLIDEFCGLLPGAQAASIRSWIDASVRFPSTMVDRIVPAATDADRDEAALLLNVADFGVVVAEPFMQWVVEDDFAGARPPWQTAGAIFTDDVAPYEAMKLRLLNGSHSAIAYLGALAGFEYVADFVANDDVAAFVRALMDVDVTPTLRVPNGFDLGHYKDQLMKRFGNVALRHRTSQIAMDGSQKLPQRLLGVVADQRARGALPRFAVLAVAAWMRYVSAGADERGRAIEVDDPLASVLARSVVSAEGDAAKTIDALLSIDQVFDPWWRDDADLRSALIESLDTLTTGGVLATIGANA